MKLRSIAALVAVLLFVAMTVRADNGVQDLGSYYKNAQTGAKTDATGNAYVNEASKDRDNFTVVTVCNDTISAGGGVSASNANAAGAMAFTAESSLVVPTYMYKKFKLMIRVIPAITAAADSVPTYRFAVQVRSHTNASGDSSSTFAWTSWENSALVATADSVGNNGVALLASGAGAGPSERVFTFEGGRGRGNVRSRQSAAMSWPDGIAVDLIDSRGQWYWAPYTSIRIRLLTNSVGNTAAACPRVIAYLAMGS